MKGGIRHTNRLLCENSTSVNSAFGHDWPSGIVHTVTVSSIHLLFVCCLGCYWEHQGGGPCECLLLTTGSVNSTRGLCRVLPAGITAKGENYARVVNFGEVA